jgi:5-methylcytosine-specific restriction protein A
MMSISELTEPAAVLKAIQEFDKIGREKFLEKYDFGPSKKFYLVHQGKHYDSKAILGAAYGYQFPKRGPLPFDQFKGGDQTIHLLSRVLGFEVIEALKEGGDISELAHQLNELAPNFGIGALQVLREQRLGHKPLTRRLFTGQTIKETYAFHSGGRQELQFNIGSENNGKTIRYGVAFSLELSFALKDISTLLPKIERFNAYLRGHEKEFDDLRMWVWHKDDTRTPDYTPKEIDTETAVAGNFIFLGTHTDAGIVDPNRILALFDRLLPLYRYTEGDDQASDSGNIPEVGAVLTNEEISATFGVGMMGGMRRSLERKLLVLISDPFKSIYRDRWEGNILHYTGMGPDGEQSLTYAQNKTLSESQTNGVSVYLLEALSPQRYTFAGRVQLSAPAYQEQQIDTKGTERKVWMFPLRLLDEGRIPEPTLQEATVIENAQAKLAKQMSLEDLKKQAKSGKKQPGRRTAQGSVYERNAAVAELAKRLSAGVCDLCRSGAPFHNKNHEAYLECHHVVWLAKGGADDMTNTVALCPNCHRKMHILNLLQDQKTLLNYVRQRNKKHNLI